MDSLYEKVIDSYLDENPLLGHMLGLHEFDGRLPDANLEKLKARVNTCKEQLKQLEALDPPKGKLNRFNHDLIVNALETEIFDLDIRGEFLDNPAIYIFPLAMIETSYTNRNFASIEERVRSITKIQQNVPEFLNQGLKNLKEELPKAKIGMSIQFGVGIKNYWQDQLIEFVSKCNDEKLIEEWSNANLKAIEALDNFVSVLQSDYLPKSHKNFALGKEKFMTILKYEEGVELTAEKLLEVGEKDLERNYQDLMKLGEKVGDLPKFLEELTLDQPTPDSLLEDVKSGLDRILQFLIKSDFVDLPTTEQCEVIHTPEFARAFASGAMNTPGPFEKGDANQAYYWVSPPDADLSPDQLVEYMKFFSHPMLEILTIHEVWPGHYLQLLYNNKSTNRIAKIFARSTSMIEGWAHYTEEAVIKAGYDADKQIQLDKLQAAQLMKALLRNVRYICAIKMHCFGMSIDESIKLFEEKAYMTPIKSKLEANRGAMDPMYLNYTLGKLLIKKLRDDYKEELESKGEQFSLKEFHNTMLSYGSPPITVLRNLMLENPGGPEDVL